MRDHERIEELLAAQTLDAPEPPDAGELRDLLADHGPTCPECERLTRELHEVAGLLAFSLAPVAIDAAIADRILATGRTAPPAETSAVVAPAPPDELAGRRARRHARVWTAVAGVAAVLVALVVVTGTVMRGPVEVRSAELSGRLVRFETPEGADGPLVMAYTPGQRGAVFWGEGLPDPGDGQTFEIWMIDDGAPIPGGCAEPVDGRIALFVDAEIGTTDTMAVTVEPTECPAEPTTDPVLIAPL